MKKAFPANINGTVFYIDEDAYDLLNTYINQLHTAFPGQEGQEIIGDIEGRIAELFAELTADSTRVITIDDVNAVIEQMGRPSDLSDAPENAAPTGEAPGSTATADASIPPQPQPMRRRLYRDERNKVFGGVLSGLAIYLGWNVTIMRLLYIVLCLCTYFWPLFIIYLIAWMVIPPARTPRQILEMYGTPVTVNNVGQTILGTADPNQTTGGNDVFQVIFSSIGKIILAIIGLAGVAVGIGGMVVFLIAVSGLIAYAGWNSIDILDNVGFINSEFHPTLGAIGAICLGLSLLIPAIGVAWAACCALFKAKGASKPIIVSAIIIEVALIIATVVLLSIANIGPIHHYTITWQPDLICLPASFSFLHI